MKGRLGRAQVDLQDPRSRSESAVAMRPVNPDEALSEPELAI